MRGAVAGGHPLTAAAGRAVLEAGGNAVDAAVGAALVSWVAESPLTGPARAGSCSCTARATRARGSSTSSSRSPGLGDERELGAMDHVDVDFSGGSTQRFHIGAASCAIPGAALGLETAHRSFGRLPWRDSSGRRSSSRATASSSTTGQAYLHRILDLILRHTPEAAPVYEQDGGALGVGDRLVSTTSRHLELLAENGALELYTGELGARIVEHIRRRRLLHAARPERSTASSGAVRCAQASTARSSSRTRRRLGRRADRLRLAAAGGARRGAAGSRGGDRRARARHARAAAGSGRRGLLRALELAAQSSRAARRTSPSIDGHGNAVALTHRPAQARHRRAWHGIHMNNMIGEFDLARSRRPGSGSRRA
jgi:gamma-glutamyltranspeptidase/glutathione hydrolase